MNTIVTARHVDVTEEIKEIISTKVENALKIFQQVVRSSRVIVSHDKLEYRVEANVELTTKKKILTAEGKDKDIKKAIDLLSAKLSKQMHKIKEMVEDHHK